MAEEERSYTHDEFVLDPRRMEFFRSPRGSLILKIGDEEFTQKAKITKRTGWTIGPTPSIIK